MKLMTLTLMTVLLAGAGATAEAGTGSPGHKGTISAYEPISTVYDSERCPRTKYSWDYASCGKTVRARVKERMCRTRGKGTHKYYYQVGDGSKTRSSVYCGADSGGGGGNDEGGGGNDEGGGGNDEGGGDGDGDGSDTGSGRAGSRGSVAAYFPARSDLFDSQRCHKKRLGYNYTSCGSILRSRVKRRVCSTRGKGTHTWYYQIGNNSKSASTVYCAR